VERRHPGKIEGPFGDRSPTLDTGFRRYDFIFLPHQRQHSLAQDHSPVTQI